MIMRFTDPIDSKHEYHERFGLLGHSQKVSHVFLVGRGHLTLNPQRRKGQNMWAGSLKIPNGPKIVGKTMVNHTLQKN